MRHHADALVTKFGFREISIDEFDMFLVDVGLADELSADDDEEPSPLEMTGFVQQRGAARNSLDKAGRRLPNQPFRLIVKKPGKVYVIMPLMEGNVESSGIMKERWQTYANSRTREALANKKSNFKALEKKKEQHERGDITAAELHEATDKLKAASESHKQMMRIQGAVLSLMGAFDDQFLLGHGKEGNQ